MIKVAIILTRPNLFYRLWESAQLLGGRKVDNQSLDDIGWWTRSISLEFEVPKEKIEKFERDLRAIYDGSITICFERSAALPT